MEPGSVATETFANGAVIVLVSVSALTSRALFAVFALLAWAAPAAATPVLFRTDKIRCDVSVDGTRVGSIGPDEFVLRAQLDHGEHIVTCKGSIKFNGTQEALPYGSSLTVKIDGDDQRVVGFPSPSLALSDIARVIGDGSIVALVRYSNGTYPVDCTDTFPVGGTQVISKGSSVDAYPAKTCFLKGDRMMLIRYDGRFGYWHIIGLDIPTADGGHFAIEDR